MTTITGDAAFPAGVDMEICFYNNSAAKIRIGMRDLSLFLSFCEFKMGKWRFYPRLISLDSILPMTSFL